MADLHGTRSAKVARFYKHRKERTLNRMLWKYVSSCMGVLLVLLALSLVIRTLKIHLMNTQAEVFPLDQLERGYVSRQSALNKLKDFMLLVRTLSQSSDPEKPKQILQSKEIVRDFSILRGLGLRTITEELRRFLPAEVAESDIEAQNSSISANISDHFNRYLVTHRFCYDKTVTPQGNQRHVDPSFCPRLVNLLNDIRHGRQPPLLTLFTWLPDPLADVDRLRRRLLFQNWNLLRPIVQPVLFSDSRTNMAFCNTFDWPCLPTISISSMEVPIFRSMASIVAARFNSTFYGYVRSTTVFDASLVETLLKLQETFIDKLEASSDIIKWREYSNRNSPRPVLLYGRALRASRVGHMQDLEHLSQVVNTTESHAWADKKDSLVYFFYTGVEFDDVPDMIVDDGYLTSVLVSRSMALGHLVVDASSTIYSVHVVRSKTTSEWGRQYLPTVPRDPYMNRRLGGQYFHSRGLTKPKKWLNEIGTKFSRTGNIYLDVRS